MRFINGFLLFCLPAFISFPGFSQSTYLPLGQPAHNLTERLEIKAGRNSPHFHAVLKPLESRAVAGFLMEADSTVRRLTPLDRLLMDAYLQAHPEWGQGNERLSRRPLLGRFYRYPQDFYRYQSDELFLVINPVLSVQAGSENDRDLWLYQNTRGLEMRGMINNKVGFYTYMADNQARFPVYVNRKIARQEGAIPGEGWNIPFGEQGWDYFTARGYIAFQATKNIGLQFGQDRNFTGYGIRSLLLSDYANNYLFLKLNTRIGRFHYQNLFARLVDFPLRTFGGRMFDAKFMAAHTLSVNLGERFQLGLFENVVFGRAYADTPRQFDPHYLNPIIFYRAVEHHMGDADKIAIGLNWRWLAGYRTAFYGQVYFDDFNIGDLRNDMDSLWVTLGLRSQRKYRDFASFRNKFGLQAGMQWVDMLGIDNLDMKLEGNWVRPFTYSHYATDGSSLRPASSYSHYSQALAHPLGANFREFIMHLQYQPHLRWLLETHFFRIRQGMDVDGVNMGVNIMRDYTSRQGDYNHTFLQGELRNVTLFQAALSWQWKPGLWLDLRYTHRGESLENAEQASPSATILQAGIRLNASPRKDWY